MIDLGDRWAILGFILASVFDAAEVSKLPSTITCPVQRSQVSLWRKWLWSFSEKRTIESISQLVQQDVSTDGLNVWWNRRKHRKRTRSGIVRLTSRILMYMYWARGWIQIWDNNLSGGGKAQTKLKVTDRRKWFCMRAQVCEGLKPNEQDGGGSSEMCPS